MDDGKLAFFIDIDQSKANKKIEEFSASIDNMVANAMRNGHLLEDMFKNLGVSIDASLEERMKVLRAAAQTAQDKISSANSEIEKQRQIAESALAKGNMAVWEDAVKDMAAAQKEAVNATAELQLYKKTLETLGRAAGQVTGGTAKANLFYVSEEDYNRAKELEDILESQMSLRAQAADEDDLTGEERLKTLIEYDKRIIATQEQHDILTSKAREAAAVLGGDMGEKAANASQRLYELNVAVQSQQGAYEGLKQRLDEVKAAMDNLSQKDNLSADESETLSNLQSEYKDLAEQIENAGNELANLQGEQKDASDVFKSIMSAMDGAEGSSQSLIGGISQLSRILTTSNNPVVIFRASLTALRGGMKLLQGGVGGLKSAFKSLTATLLSNPFTAIAVAVAALVAGIIALVNSIKSATQRQIEQNKAMAAYLDYIQQRQKITDAMYSDQIDAGNRQVEVLKTQKKSLEEIHAEEDRVMQIREAQVKKNLKDNKKYIDNIDNNRVALQMLQKQLEKVKEVQAKDEDDKVEYVISGKKLKAKAKDAVKALEGEIKNKEVEVQIGVTTRDDAAKLAVEKIKQEATRIQEQYNAADAETSAMRAATNARLSLISDSYVREVKMAKQASKEKIADLNKRLVRETNMSKDTRDAIYSQIYSEQQALNDKLDKLEYDHQQKILSIRRQVEDTLAKSLPQTYNQQRKALATTYERLIGDVQNKIDNAKVLGLSEDEVNQYKALLKAYRKLQLKESEDLERQIEAQRIAHTKEAIGLQLEAVKAGTAEELELRLKAIETEQIAAIQANAALPKAEQQSEYMINAKYDRQRYNLLLSNYETFEQKRLDIAELYAEKRKQLYDGEGVLKLGITQGNVDNINRDEANQLAALYQENEEQFAIWVNGLQEKSVLALERILGAARTKLQSLITNQKELGERTEENSEEYDKLTEEIQRVVAQIGVLQNKLQENPLTPEQKSLEEWEKFNDKLQELGSTISTLGDNIGGTMGEAISHIGSAVNTVGNLITMTKKLTEVATRDIEETADASAKAIKTVEEASVVLALVGMLLELLNEIQEMLDGISEWAEENDIGWLEDIITAMQTILKLANAFAVIGMLLSKNEDATESWETKNQELERTLGRLQRAYQSLQKEIDKTFGSNKKKLIDEQIKNLTQQNSVNDQRIRAAQENVDRLKKKRDKKTGGNWLQKGLRQLTGTGWSQADENDYQAALDELEKLKNNTADYADQIADLKEQAVDAIFGEDIQSAITGFGDALISAWEEGTDAAEISADYMVDMFKKAVKQELYAAIEASEEMEKIRAYAALATDKATGKKITQEDFMPGGKYASLVKKITVSAFGSELRFSDLADIQNLLNMTYEEVLERGKQEAEDAQEGLDMYANIWKTLVDSEDEANTRSGSNVGIAQASQESIDELNGRMTAVQGHTFIISECTVIIRDMVSNLYSEVQMIHNNTTHLVRMDNDLNAMRNDLSYVLQHGITLAQ